MWASARPARSAARRRRRNSTSWRRRPALQRFQHHRDLLADPRVAADRPQPASGRLSATCRTCRRVFPATTRSGTRNTACVAEILRENGYSTAAFGKWHNTPIWEISPVGPFDHWPTGLGFEYFYGFMCGESSEWEPRLYRDTAPVEPPASFQHGYHLTTDLVNDALHWVREHDAVAPEKPFFLYFATGATHAPHHVPKEWIDKYKGKFDQGWDKLREETFARQKKLGVIPANAELTPRPKELPAWDSLTADQKSSMRGRWKSMPASCRKPMTSRPPAARPAGRRQGRQHAGDLRRRRQWRQRRRRAGRLGYQPRHARRGEAATLPTMLSHIDDLGSPLLRQSLRRRLVLGDHHAVPMDEADRLAFRRHARRLRGVLARPYRTARGGPAAIQPRERHRAHHLRGGRDQLPRCGQRREAIAAGRPQPGADLHRPGGARPATTSSISKSSATAPSTRMAGSPARAAMRRGSSSPIRRRSSPATSKKTAGSFTTSRKTSARRTTWRPKSGQAEGTEAGVR